MSSILKALQKLERDKETRKTKEPDISSAITMSRVRKKEQTRWLIPVVMLSVAVVSILTTFSLMGGFSGRKQATMPSAAPPVQPQQPNVTQLPVQPSPTAPLVTIPQPAQSPGADHARPPVVTRPRPAAMPSPPAPRVEKLPSAPDETTAAQQQPAAMQQPTPLAEKPPARPKLEINGIAWQQDSASRIAVVNGRSVSEGNSVDGARVEQIFPDKVRFSHSGKTFEVTMEREGRP